MWGFEVWKKKSAERELEYPGLKTMNDKERAEIAADWVEMLRNLVDSGLISSEHASAELKARKIFKRDYANPADGKSPLPDPCAQKPGFPALSAPQHENRKAWEAEKERSGKTAPGS